MAAKTCLRRIVMAGLGLAFLGPTTTALARDNFLVIVADDLGVDGVNVYSRDDLYGHAGEGAAPGPTPTLDQLAAEGVLFRNAWSSPTCAPARAQALTGRHAFRTGVGTAEAGVLAPSETTLADILAASHATAAIGKWHNGADGDAQSPIELGFDSYVGALGGSVAGYFSWQKVRASAAGPSSSETVTTYATTDTADEAIAAIAAFGDAPWFVWLAFNAPHTPFHVPPAALRTTSVDSGSSAATKWKAAIEAMDTEIGRVLESIPASVLADTTIIFLGDNGSPRQASEAPFSAAHAKDSVYEGGINVPLIVKSPRIAVADRGRENSALVSATNDIFATIAEIAGVATFGEDSASLVPYLEDPSLGTLATRPQIFAQSFEPNGFGPYTAEERAIRDDTWKLIWRDGAFAELFNLVADPFETDDRLAAASLTSEEQAAYDSLATAMASVAIFCPSIPDAACQSGFAKASLDWRDPDGAGDRFLARMQKGPALGQTDFGDPLATGGTGYAFCLFDQNERLIARLRVERAGATCPDDEACWRSQGAAPPAGKGYRYRDDGRSADGVWQMKLQGGGAGTSKIELKGMGDALPDGVPAALLDATALTLQLRGTDAPQCVSATLGEVQISDADRFKAR